MTIVKDIRRLNCYTVFMTDETEPLEVDDPPEEWGFVAGPNRGRALLSGIGSGILIVGELVIAGLVGYMLGYILGAILGKGTGAT